MIQVEFEAKFINKTICGDCLDIIASMPADSIDTIITDPPYGLEFMGKGWDKILPDSQVWTELLRIAKPGAIFMAFGGTRTFHRLTCAIEDAGWQIRDTICWLYGSGFPKSHDISKAIDKAKGAEREVVGQKRLDGNACIPCKEKGGAYGVGVGTIPAQDVPITAPATDLARPWGGWGTALKPAWEPIIVAMKPLDGTFAQNAEKWGVAGLWIDGGRINSNRKDTRHGGGVHSKKISQLNPDVKGYDLPQGRWPANLIHDGSDEVLAGFPQTGVSKRANRGRGFSSVGSNDGYKRESHDNPDYQNIVGGYDDNGGSAARFFYCAKASRAERNAGLEGNNGHPTVKPLALTEYLCKLTKTPTGGVVLDPFAGSGTTGVACINTGRDYILIEKEKEYCEITRQRIASMGKTETLF